MSGIAAKPHVPYKTKVFPSVLLSPKDTQSFVFDDQTAPTQKLAYFQSPRRLLKLGHLVPESKKDISTRNQSLPQISNMFLKGGSSKNAYNDEQLNNISTKRYHDRNGYRERGPLTSSPNTSDIELKDSSIVMPSVITFETTSKFGSRKTISPARSPDVTRDKDNLVKVMNYTKSLKSLAKEVGKEPTRKKAKLCQNILNSLSKEEGKYQDEIGLLKLEIRNSVFCSSQDVLDRIDMISEDILKNMTRLSLPYFEIVNRLLDFIEQSQNKTLEKQQEDQQMIMKLKNQIETQAGYKNNGLSQEQKIDIEQITKEFNKSLEILKSEKMKMYLELQSYIEDVEAVVGSVQVDEYVEQINLLSNQKIETEKQLKERSAEGEKVKLFYMNILDQYKVSLVKMNTLKDQVDKLEESVGQLRTENAKLVSTVTGFSHLTPRPSLGPILAFLGLESKRRESTAENIDFINKVIKNSETKEEE